MRAYEAGQALYFATPPVNLIYALNASLKLITATSPSLKERFALHKEASRRVKDAVRELGMSMVPLEQGFAGEYCSYDG